MAENRQGTARIAERFSEQGYCFPIEVLSPGEAAEARARLEALAWHGRIRASQNEALYAGADEGPS